MGQHAQWLFHDFFAADNAENFLHHQVCSGAVTLAVGMALIFTKALAWTGLSRAGSGEPSGRAKPGSPRVQ